MPENQNNDATGYEWGASSWDARDHVEFAETDRADCHECGGRGADADGVVCEYCCATGKQATRDELANWEKP